MTTATFQAHSLDEVAALLDGSPDFRVLRRFVPGPRTYRELYSAPPPQTRVAAFVDVETTGLEADAKIIELAIVRFEYEAESGRVLRTLAAYQSFNDPGAPLSREIVELTGITDEMVRGQRISREAVAIALSGLSLVIAHNADFDRVTVERELPTWPKDLAWACTYREIEWKRFGCVGSKLENVLAGACRAFYDAHRASDDCYAGIHALATAELEGRSAMSYLVESARQITARVWAIGAPFHVKDALKARKYRWNDGTDGRPKAWYRDLPEADLLLEQAWLAQLYYGGGSMPRAERLTARERYSTRAGL